MNVLAEKFFLTRILHAVRLLALPHVRCLFPPFRFNSFHSKSSLSVAKFPPTSYVVVTLYLYFVIWGRLGYYCESHWSPLRTVLILFFLLEINIWFLLSWIAAHKTSFYGKTCCSVCSKFCRLVSMVLDIPVLVITFLIVTNLKDWSHCDYTEIWKSTRMLFVHQLVFLFLSPKLVLNVTRV